MGTQRAGGRSGSVGAQPGPGSDAWHVRICGDVSITAPDGTVETFRGAQPRLALAMLALEQRAVRRDELAEEFWGVDRLPDHWQGAVRGVVAKVRAQLVGAGLPPDTLEAGSGLIELRLPAPVVVDVDQAAAAVGAAESALAAGTPSEAIEQAREAASILTQPVAVDGDGTWQRHLRQRVETIGASARHIEVDALLASEKVHEALALAEASLVLDPLDEMAHQQVIRAHLGAGRPIAATRAYDSLRTLLAAELGAAPSSDARALVAHITSERAPTAGLTIGRDPLHRPPLVPVKRFLGRHAELEAALAIWREVVDTGEPRLITIGGPAGIGKTRLADELVARIDAMGGGHLWGRCRARSGVAFEPYQDAFRTWCDVPDGPGLARFADAAAGVIRLLPELAQPGTASSWTGVDRAVVIRDVIASIARFSTEPAVLVIDDYQWASGDTAALTERLLADVGRPLLVVLTHRVGPVDPVAVAHLSEVLRAAPAAALRVAELTASDLSPVVAELGTLTGDASGHEQLTRALYDRTGGHPYFLTEIVRDVRRLGLLDLERTPDVARTWVQARIDALEPEHEAALEWAAVLGTRVDLELLADLVGSPLDEVLETVEVLVDQGFLVESGEPGWFAFPHEITREVGYDRIGRTRRALFHRQVADRIAAAGDAPGRAAVAAGHYQLAGPKARELAADHLLRAASESFDQSAWSLAAEQLEAALAQVDDAPRRARILVMLGRAQHCLGRPEEAVAHLERSVQLATDQRLPFELAEATCFLVGRGGRGAGFAMPDRERIARLETALAGLDRWGVDGDPDRSEAVDDQAREEHRVRIEGELAWAQLFVADPDDRRRLVVDSLRRVRSRPDSPPLQRAMALLNVRQAKHLPDQLEERLADLDEILAMPQADLLPDVVVAAHLYGHEDLLVTGRHDAARRRLLRAEEVADAFGHPYWRWAVATWRSLGLLIDGDADGAEQALLASMALQAGTPPEAVACLGVQLVSIRVMQGRSHEVIEQLRTFADENTHIPCYRAVLAFCASESDELDVAESAYAHFSRAAFTNIPDDPNRVLTLAMLGDAAATLGDAAGVRALRAQLLPWAGLHVVHNCYGGGGAYWGPVSRILARGALVTDEPSVASTWFADATAQAAAFDAPLMVERIRRDQMSVS